MRQYIYDADTVHKNFWCCYTKAFFVGGGLRIINTLNDFAVTFDGQEETLKGLYDALCTGVDDDVLSQIV